MPAVITAAALCLLTNWAGTAGMTEVRFRHTGYYDHAWDRLDRIAASGARPVYEALAHDRSARVIAMAQQPDCFIFPCITQSYTDIEGSGGNVTLVKTLKDWKEFLDHSGVTHIYTDDAFLAERSRAADIVRDMLDEGSLKEVVSSGGKSLYRYDTAEER